MDSRSGRPRVVVVGAGPGGLAAAVLLQARGVDVTVLERQESIGGRTSRVTVGEYGFDLGPTFFLMPHVLQEVFRVAGRDLFEEVDLRRLDPMYRLVIGRPGAADVTIDATQDPDEMARRLGAVHAPDGEAFARFTAHNRRKLAAAEPILRRPIRSALDLVRPDAVRALPYINPHRTVHDLNSRYFTDPAVRLAVGFQSKYLGMSPMDCPSLFTILPFIEYEYGVWHPIGGCHALMRALARVLIDLGGTIRTGAEVAGLDLDGRRVVGVSLADGERVACEHAVINADATWAMKRLIPERLRGRETDAEIDNRKFSCSTYMLYLGVEGAVDLPHHTIRTSPEYEQNLEDISRERGRAGTLTPDPSFYVCNASATDATLAPEGHSSVSVLMPTPTGRAPIDWAGEDGRVRALLLDRMKRVLGVDLSGRIRAERRITPDDWRAMNITHGATFNLAHSLDQMLHRRPKHRLPYVDGAWLVGGGTHPGSGLPVIFLSSQITGGMILDELGLESGFEPISVAQASADARLELQHA
ncbi:MAG: phytoene desaturase family protein [Phycisphaerales bacterium JB040]